MAKKNAADSKPKGIGSRSNDEWAIKWSREIGQHFKAICKKHGYTAEMVGDVVALSSSSVNHVYAGTQPLTSSQAKLIAGKFGINWQYCYAVGDETPSAELQRLHDDYSVALAYLKTLGIELEPGYYWEFHHSNTASGFLDLFENYIESKSDVERVRDSLANSGDKDVKEYIRLCADPTADSKIQEFRKDDNVESQKGFIHSGALPELDALTKQYNSARGGSTIVVAPYDNLDSKIDMETIRIKYELKIDGKLQRLIDLREFKNIIGNVDRMARAAALSALEIQY